MNDLEISVFLFVLGVIAGFLNVMAGGGSTLTIPAFIWIGFDAALANGTNRVAILVQNIAAIISFKKDKYSNFRMSLKMAALTVPGAVAGALLAINIDDETFKTILGIVMIGIVVTMLVPRKKIDELTDTDMNISWKMGAAMFAVGFYGGFIQAGVGFVIMAVLFYMMKMSLIKVNMHKVFIVFIFTVPALLIFMIAGHVDYTFGLIHAAGNAIGGWFAAKYTIKKGEKIIRAVLIISILIMALKMIGVGF